ncbi:hypothetical protein AYO44_08435 [Planctomycetaceae bacterium SCGC AG-212-F19]|nr:hypothetical protein AYO44_08435 [Planctomycetaceae bacterium SCGC AG-212-F19]
MQRTYPVAHLIIPVDNYFTQPGSPLPPIKEEKPQPPATCEDKLIKLILNTVAPDSWAENGGHGTMDYFPLGMALVVNQTAAVHEQIAALLDSLRRNLDKEVGVELRVVSIGEKMARQLREEFGIDCTRCKKTDDTAETPQVTMLNDIELFKLFECFQGDRQTNVMQAPKLTLFNGQASSCQILDYQWFVTNVEVVENAGQAVFVPQNLPIALGWDMGVQPVISGDGKAVRVNVNVKYTNLVSANVPLFPVTKFITPVFEGGAQGVPVPFTQFIQQPNVSTWKVNQAVNVPTNGTALLSGWKMEVEKEWDGPPVLEHIPFVNTLFRQMMTLREPRYMLLMVTPRIVETTETIQAAAPPVPPAPVVVPTPCVAESVAAAAPCAPAPPELAVMPTPFQAPVASPTESDFLKDVKRDVAGLLVQKYREACRHGRTEDAKTLAEEALRLDPACFSTVPMLR